jgi:hypothetical protein
VNLNYQRLDYPKKQMNTSGHGLVFCHLLEERDRTGCFELVAPNQLADSYQMTINSLPRESFAQCSNGCAIFLISLPWSFTKLHT